MTGFIDKNGDRAQLELTVQMYAHASEAGQSLPQWLATNYPTQNAERDGSTFKQLMAAEGIYVKGNREFGIAPSTMADIVGRPSVQGAVVTKEATPASRILFPAVIMSAVEDKLVANLDINANAFDQLIALDESISGYRYEQPVLNFSKPEAARSRNTGQLAEPAAMLTITASDKAYAIPQWSIGLEVSDQALQASTLDFVALSLARQFAVERNERAQNYILAILNGDVDNGEVSLATLGLMDNASTFDAAATGGAITQKAWMKYLMKNGTKRVISHIITDIDTAMKVETRTGKPEITKDDSKTSRIDTQFSLMNPTWAKNPALFLTDIAAWPANTMVGLDKNYALRRVRNLLASYQAIEAYVMRRSTAMRFDAGEHVNRLFNDAFGGLVLA